MYIKKQRFYPSASTWARSPSGKDIAVLRRLTLSYDSVARLEGMKAPEDQSPAFKKACELSEMVQKFVRGKIERTITDPRIDHYFTLGHPACQELRELINNNHIGNGHLTGGKSFRYTLKIFTEKTVQVFMLECSFDEPAACHDQTLEQAEAA